MTIQIQPHQKYDPKNFERLNIQEPWNIPLAELAPRLCGHRYTNDAVSQSRSLMTMPGSDPRDTSPTWYHRNPKDWFDHDYPVNIGSLKSAVDVTLFVHRELINVVPFIPIASGPVNLAAERMFGNAGEEQKDKRSLDRVLHDNDYLGSPLAKLQDQVDAAMLIRRNSEEFPRGFDKDGIAALKSAGDLLVVFAHLSLRGRQDPVFLREYSNSGKRIKRLADEIMKGNVEESAV